MAALVEMGWRIRKRRGSIKGKRSGEERKVMDGIMLERGGGGESRGQCIRRLRTTK